MTYKETCEYLFNQTANFESQGKSGYKPGLETMTALDEHFGSPHANFRTIHVAGTNGKGSVSHTLASMLQVCGYKVGLYTSPHLLDFSERIRVNGVPINEDYVVNFVEHDKEFFEQRKATFFEIATMMAFQYFSDSHVDIAVVEVGLGGRLDSTNIVHPVLSIITNISLDHTQLLGNSLEQIAMEKGGIIKAHTPVIIGEALPETRPVFEALAAESSAPVIFAEDVPEVLSAEPVDTESCGFHYVTASFGEFNGELGGIYQAKNTETILAAVRELIRQGFLCQGESDENKKVFNSQLGYAFSEVSKLTGLKGRWQQVGVAPRIVCDTAHNVGGWKYLHQQLAAVHCERMHIVFGMVDDKDVYGVMSLLPTQAIYYFTKASTKRALSEQSVQVLGSQLGLNGNCYCSVREAFMAAKNAASENDFIFVGGSSYVVADFLKTCF